MNYLKMLKTTGFCLLLSIVLLLLPGCSSASSESEILQDIEDVDMVLGNYVLDTSISITKRQTNRSDKTDYVWATVTGTNDYTLYEAKYYLYYVLYNDGWQVESIQMEWQQTTPISETEHSADEVFDYIASESDFWAKQSRSNMTIEIIDRQTNMYYGTDEVTLDIFVMEEDFWLGAQYLVTYYWDIDNGWIFSDYDELEWDVTPMKECDRSIADAYMSENYDNYTLVAEYSDSEAGFHDKAYSYHVQYKEEGMPYITFTDEVIVFCDYNIWDSWHVASNLTSQDKKIKQWDILGEWTDYSGDDYVYINIISMDDETVSLEYEFDVTDYGTRHDTGKASSNGIITLEWGWSLNGNYNYDSPYQIYISRENNSIWVDCLRGVTWLGVTLNHN